MDVMTLAAKLTLNTSEFDTNLQNSEKEMQGLSSGGVAWGNLVARTVEKAAKAVVQFGKKTVEVGMDFDAQMSQVKALGQMQDADFQRVRKRAMELGETTKFTAAEVGEAFSYMALAGWDTDEMLAGIDGVLNLAAASGEDLGRTSDIITDALTAFGLEAEDAAHFVDVLAAASANSNTTVSQMGEAFKYLATTGGVLGYSIDDVALALGLLANNGIKSGQAGTSLRRILTSLISPTEGAADAMSALGISLFEEGTDKVKPLKQVLTELRTIFKEADFNLEGISSEEAQQSIDELDAWYDELATKIEEGGGSVADAVTGSTITMKDLDAEYAERIREITGFNEDFLGKLSDIGGVRGISSLIALMKTTDKDFDQLVGSIENSEGSAQEMAETMLDNLMGDITIMKSALEGLQIVVSDEFKESFRSFVQMLTEEIGQLNSAFQDGGVVGMFSNLVKWLVEGLADAVKDVSAEDALAFGEAIGNLVGELISYLVTNGPEIIGGMIRIGTGIAEGLIDGLMAGLFGDKTELNKYKEQFGDELADIEVDNATANAITAYLESLVEKYGENASKTEEWKSAVERLNEVLPGASEILSAQGTTLAENLQKVKDMREEYRKIAIQNSLSNLLQKQYEHLGEQQVELERQYARKEEAEYGIKAQEDDIKSMYVALLDEYDRLVGGRKEEGMPDYNLPFAYEHLFDRENEGNFNLNNLKIVQGIIDDLYMYGEEKIWDKSLVDNILNPEELDAVGSYLDGLEQQIADAEEKITATNSEIENTNGEISLTEKAVNKLAGELASDAEAVDAAGDNLAAAINGAAEGLGGGDGSHAIGSPYIPYDNYVANLHRGEMVLTATQARKYRNGDGGSLNYDAIAEIVAIAVSDAVGKVNVLMSGEKVGNLTTKRVKNNINSFSYSRLRAFGG